MAVEEVDDLVSATAQAVLEQLTDEFFRQASPQVRAEVALFLTTQRGWSPRTGLHAYLDSLSFTALGVRDRVKNLPPIDNRAPFSATLQVPDHLGDPLIAVASQEDRVKIRVWNTVTGAVEGRSMSPPPIKATGAPSGGGGRVTAMTMTRMDIGHYLLVTGNANHTIRLWDLATRTLLHRLNFGEEITACHASGERLVVGSQSGVTLLKLNQTPG